MKSKIPKKFKIDDVNTGYAGDVVSEVVTGATGGVGIPLIDILPKFGSTGGGGGIPAKTAGSGTAMFSSGMVKRGLVVPNNWGSDPSPTKVGDA